MQDANRETDVIHRLVHRANDWTLVHALVLTSSRANERAPLDLLSDYDVIVVVSEMRPFSHDESWLHEFGKVLLLYDLDHRVTSYLQSIRHLER